MAKRNQIIKFLDEYLKIDKWPDDYHNGLEFSGTNEIKKIVTGVTPSMELFEKAKKKKSQMIITHHSLLLRGDKYQKPPSYDLKRLKYLKKNNLNYANYHLPLDFHNEIGNEVLTLKQFGFEIIKPKFYCDGGLYGGKIKTPITLQAILNKGKKLYPDKPVVFRFGPKKITNIAVITGSAASFYDTAYTAGARTIITGNPKVETPDVAKELGLNVILYGHHNTEKIGIKALGELISKKFDIEHEFINIPNSI